MRILFVVADLKLPRNPDVEGASGAISAALGTAKALVQRGHEVWVAVVGRDAWQSEWHGVRLVQLPVASWARFSIAGRSLDFRVQIPFILLTLRHRFDVVQGYLHHYLRFLRARLRVVNFQIDPLYPGRDGASSDFKPADFAVVTKTSQIQTGASRFVVEQVLRGSGGAANVHLVYNGVDIDRFNAARWEPERELWRRRWDADAAATVFLYAGAIVPEKGVLHLAHAFVRLAARRPNVHLVLAGGNTLWAQNLSHEDPARAYEEAVREALEPARQAGAVHFTGNIAVSAMPAVYAAADVLVVPSVWQEAFGLVALEGLASGRAVIASATGGLSELVTYQTGVPVPPGDEGVLLGAMEALVDSPARRQSLGAAARSHAAHFTWEATARALDTLYATHLRGAREDQQCAAS